MPSTAPEALDHANGTASPFAAGWRMWVPVLVMMTCSWLSYIDRQTLAVISPMILKDTGLSASDYADAVSAFSFAYMIANPLWGSGDRLRRAARRNVRGGRHLDGRERVARLGSRICTASPRRARCLAWARVPTFPGGLRTDRPFDVVIKPSNREQGRDGNSKQDNYSHSAQ